MSLTFLLIFKYSNTTRLNITEISDEVTSSDVNIGLVGSILSIISIFILIFIVGIYEGTSYEISHLKSKEILTSRFWYTPNLVEKILTFVRCVLYTNFAEEFYKTFLILSFVTYLVQGFIHLTYMPYYNSLMNTLKLIQAVEGMLFTFAFFLGHTSDNSNTILYLSIILQPCIIFIVISFCIKRQEEIKNQPDGTKTINFEHFLREKLINQEKIPGIFKLTRKHYELSKNQIIFVIEALYSIHMLNNSMIGLNKLKEYKWSTLNIFLNFQIFKLTSLIEKNFEPSSGIKTVIFLHQMEKIIKKEEKYTKNIESLSNELSQNPPSLSKLKSFITKISKNKGKIKKSYRLFLKLYPNSFVGYEMFGTFLFNILQDTVNGVQILEKAKIEKQSKTGKNKKESIFSTLTSNLMLVSCDKGSLGKILFLSESLCNMLKIEFTDSKSYYLKEFIPEPISSIHDMFMINFIKYAEVNKFIPDSPFVMLTKENFLVECEIHAEMVTKNNTLLFVIEIKQLKINREAAFVDSNGFIYSHTQNFGKILGLQENRNLNGNSIYSLVNQPLFEDQVNIIKVIDETTGLSMEVALNFLTRRVISTDLVFVFCSTDNSQRYKSVSGEMKSRKITKSKGTIKITFQSGPILNEKTNSLHEDEQALTKSQTLDSSNQYKGADNSKIGNFFRFFKVIFYIMTLILAVIIVVIIIYVQDQLDHSISLDSINIFGYYKYSACYFSLITLSIQFTDMMKFPKFFTDSEILSVKNDLDEYELELHERYRDWSYCDATKLFTTNDFMIYSKNSSEKSNFINQMILFRDIVEDFYEKTIKNEKDYDDQVYYLIVNIMRLSYVDFDRVHDKITTCEETKLDLLKGKVILIFTIGVISISLLFFFLLFFTLVLQKRLNEKWRILYKKFKHSYQKLEALLSDRVLTVHKQLPQKRTILPKLSKPSSFNDFSHFLFYLLRFSLFFIFILILYFVGILHYYNSLDELLVKRVKFNNIELDARSNIMQISFFMLYSVDKLYTENEIKYLIKRNPYKDSELEQILIIDTLNEIRTEYYTVELKDLYTNSAWSLFFDTLPNGTNFMNSGLLTAYSHLIQESLNLISNKPTLDDLSAYFTKIRQLASIFKKINNKLVTNSNEKIIEIIRGFIVFSLLWLILTSMLVFFVYRPFLSSEQSLILNIDHFISALPAPSSKKNN